MEAQYALARGILIPVLLDNITSPLGFGEVQYASLANPASADDEMKCVISSIKQLSQDGVSVEEWESIGSGAQTTRYGVEEADRFLEDVRARSDILRQNPGSGRALRYALCGARQTYGLLIGVIDQFRSLLTSGTNLTAIGSDFGGQVTPMNGIET